MCIPNRWTNEETMKTCIEETIVPYVRQKREQLNLDDDRPALFASCCISLETINYVMHEVAHIICFIGMSVAQTVEPG